MRPFDDPDESALALLFVAGWSDRGCLLMRPRIDLEDIASPAVRVGLAAAFDLPPDLDGWARCAAIDAAIAEAGYRPRWRTVLELGPLAPVLYDESGSLAAAVTAHGRRRKAKELLSATWRALEAGDVDAADVLAGLGRTA